MDKKELVEIAELAAEKVLAKRDAVIQEELDARYLDVQLLLRNYRKLKAHYAHASPETLEVSSICSMHRKTKLMMSHVDKMIATYQAMCAESENADEQRRWNALRMRFLSEKRMSVDDIAEALHIDKRTFYRDINKAQEDMAVLLFGIEAIGSRKRKK